MNPRFRQQITKKSVFDKDDLRPTSGIVPPSEADAISDYDHFSPDGNDLSSYSRDDLVNLSDQHLNIHNGLQQAINAVGRQNAPQELVNAYLINKQNKEDVDNAKRKARGY